MSPIMKDPVWTKLGTDGAFILLSVIYFLYLLCLRMSYALEGKLLSKRNLAFATKQLERERHAEKHLYFGVKRTQEAMGRQGKDS